MLLTCVGTGTAAPEPDRASAGFLVEVEDRRILFDCGPGVLHSMARHLVSWPDITHLVLTHFHNDHIGDVPALFQAWKHGMRPARTQPLVVVGPPGTAHLLHAMAALFGRHIREPGFDVDVRETGPDDPLPIGGSAVLNAGASGHTEAALAYRLEADGRSFCYTGDTGPVDPVARFSRGVDTLLTECSVPDDEAMATHLSPSGLAWLARQAMPRQLLVTHVYPQLPRGEVPKLVRAAGWSGAIRIVHDGMRIEL